MSCPNLYTFCIQISTAFLETPTIQQLEVLANGSPEKSTVSQ